MYKSDNGKFKEGIIWWDTKEDKNSDVDVFFYIHDFEGRAKYKYGFKSLEIDLKQSKEERWNDYQSSLRRQLRRAEEEQFEIKFDDNPNDDAIKTFVETFNSFAEFKKIGKTSEGMLQKIRDDKKLVLSYIYKEGVLLASHSHYFTNERTRLYQSCSTNNEFDNKTNAQANKFLTDKDFDYFKEKGINIYDFGGIGNVEGDNTRFEGIIKFKKLFGGKEIILWKGVTPNGEHGEEVYNKYWK